MMVWKVLKLRPELFVQSYEICGHIAPYADNMTIIIITAKNTIVRIAMKIDFLITELKNSFIQ